MATDIPDFYRGDTKKYNIELTDDAGDPISLDGARIRATLKSDLSLPDNQAELSVDTGVISDTAGSGTTLVTFSAAATAALTPGKYYYDFQLTNASAEVKTLLAGRVKVLADATITTP